MLSFNNQKETREKPEDPVSVHQCRQFHVAICLDASTDVVETTNQVQRLASTLEKVDIYLEHSFLKGTSEEFEQLMKVIGSLPKLRSLRIRSISLDGRFVQLPFSTTLETVLLRQSSKHSSSTLRRLDLSYVDFTFSKDKGETPCTHCPLMGLIRFLERNNNNQHLKELNFHYGGYRKISKSTQRALLDMLQYKNYSLEYLDFDMATWRQFSTSKRRRIQFYLALNREGLRQKLLNPQSSSSTTTIPPSPSTSSDWKDAIISNRDQSSMVYYLLCNNPTMICA